MKSVLAAAGLVVLTLTSSACVQVAGPPEPTLDEVRVAVEKYRDVNVAIADGYVRDSLDRCEAPAHRGLPAELGVMGVHYLRPDLLGIDPRATRLDVTAAHTDFLQPAALLYEPQADGTLELVAIENLVSASAWQAADNRQPPSFQGETWEHQPEESAQMIAEHYDRHIWLFRENPSGIYAQYNPDATCDHHVLVMPMWHPEMEAEMDHAHP